MASVKSNINPSSKKQVSQWFEDLIDQIKVDKMLIESDVASKSTKDLYDLMMSDDTDKMIYGMRKTTEIHFVKEMVTNYLNFLLSSEHLPSTLAFKVSNNNKIYIWGVIPNDNENVEDAMILAEASVNGKFYQYGFNLTSTIVEESDNLPQPPQYNNIPISELIGNSGEFSRTH